jgi:hypothetical protein
MSRTPCNDRISFGDIIAAALFVLGLIAIVFVTDFAADPDDPEGCEAFVESEEALPQPFIFWRQ